VSSVADGAVGGAAVCAAGCWGVLPLPLGLARNSIWLATILWRARLTPSWPVHCSSRTVPVNAIWRPLVRCWAQASASFYHVSRSMNVGSLSRV
jgi:hypothetical protein